MGRFLLILIVAAFVAYLVPAPVSHRAASVEIHATKEKVWEVLSDLPRIPSWNGGALKLEFLTRHTQGPGARFRVPGTPISRTFEVTDWRAYNRIDLRVTTDPRLTNDHILTYSIRPTGERTAVLLDEDYRVRGGYLGYLLDRVYLGPSGEKSRSAALANLKRLVETGNEILLP